MSSVFLGEVADIRHGLSRRDLRGVGGPAVQVIQRLDWPQEVLAQAGGSGWANPLTCAPAHFLQDGDILFLPRGKPNRAWLLSAPANMVCAAPLLRLRCKNPTQVLPRYLQWVLNLPSTGHWLNTAEAETGGRITVQTLARLRMPLCCLERQEQIADIHALHLRRYILTMRKLEVDAKMQDALLTYAHNDTVDFSPLVAALAEDQA